MTPDAGGDSDSVWKTPYERQTHAKEPMLELLNLNLGGTTPFSHRFPAGGITVVVGPNNSGKTRLARCIAGLERSPAGTVAIDGVDVSGLGARKRRVGLVYQAFVNYPNWTVFRNIASPLVAAGARRERVARKVEDLARRLQIDDLLERMPHELSGGQQQRVAVARALAQGGQVLVMDEPLVNLDFKLREELELQLRELVQAEGVAVVYLTSDPKDAFKLGDEVVLLHDRKKLQSGPPLAVYQAPASALAADLLSEPRANRIDGQTLVRPEHLRLSPHGEGDVVFQAEVRGVETSGAETFLHCCVRGQDWVARLPGMPRVEDGGKVRLYAAPTDILSFKTVRHTAETAKTQRPEQTT